jgi:threonine/homoserine/homoserine lactone efflux protein
MTLAFLGAVLALALLTIMPGPDVAIVTRVVLAHGKAAAFRTALGIATGLLFWGFLTVIGLSALLAASTTAYLVVKFAGAAYLIWLGLKTIWHSRQHTVNEPAVMKRQRAHRPWLTGFINNSFNPKIAVFYTSLLPQLVPRGTACRDTIRSGNRACRANRLLANCIHLRDKSIGQISPTTPRTEGTRPTDRRRSHRLWDSSRHNRTPLMACHSI